MFLLIFQSIGTQELILIGMVALIFLGPRKLPEYARKIGKIMTEFRSTTSEFRQTWEREINFEEEANALKAGFLDDDEDAEPAKTLPREKKEISAGENNLPEVREIDASEFEALRKQADEKTEEQEPEIADTTEVTDELDKRTWL